LIKKKIYNFYCSYFEINFWITWNGTLSSRGFGLTAATKVFGFMGVVQKLIIFNPNANKSFAYIFLPKTLKEMN
jgi:hypothetical protein